MNERARRRWGKINGNVKVHFKKLNCFSHIIYPNWSFCTTQILPKLFVNSERSIEIWYPMSKPIQNASLPRLFKCCLNFFQAGISPIVSTVYYLPYALCLKAVGVEGSGPYLKFITYTLCTEQKLYLTSAKASPGSVYLLFCDSDLKIKTTPNWRTKLFFRQINSNSAIIVAPNTEI